MNIKYIEELALKISLKLGFDDIQNDIIDELIDLFTTYPELARILAANPTLSIEEALEIIHKMECFFDKTVGTQCTIQYLNAEKQDSLTLIALLLIYLLQQLAESERREAMQKSVLKNKQFKFPLKPRPCMDKVPDKKKKKDRRDPK